MFKVLIPKLYKKNDRYQVIVVKIKDYLALRGK